jgi:hypothetical protein
MPEQVSPKPDTTECLIESLHARRQQQSLVLNPEYSDIALYPAYRKYRKGIPVEHMQSRIAEAIHSYAAHVCLLVDEADNLRPNAEDRNSAATKETLCEGLFASRAPPLRLGICYHSSGKLSYMEQPGLGPPSRASPTLWE